MDKERIEELIDLLKKNNLKEIEVQYSWAEKVRIVQNSTEPVIEQRTVPEVTSPAKAEKPEPVKSDLLEIKSPIVGTFYRKPSPDEDPYVKIGDHVEKGQVICLIEAMKIFNEIKSEVSGQIKQVLVEDGQPIEYGHVLYLVDPKG